MSGDQFASKSFHQLKRRSNRVDTHRRIHSSILGDDFERDDLVRFSRLWADVWKLTASATGSTDEDTLACRTTGVVCELEFPPGVFLPGSCWGAVLGRLGFGWSVLVLCGQILHLQRQILPAADDDIRSKPVKVERPFSPPSFIERRTEVGQRRRRLIGCRVLNRRCYRSIRGCSEATNIKRGSGQYACRHISAQVRGWGLTLVSDQQRIPIRKPRDHLALRLVHLCLFLPLCLFAVTGRGLAHALVRLERRDLDQLDVDPQESGDLF
jgi:hypothetical protein